MEAEHRVWVMFCTRSSIFLWIDECFPFWVFPNLTANSMRSKKEVFVWNTSQLFDKKHCTLSLMVIWTMILFQSEKAVSMHLGKPLHLRCASGNRCSLSSCSGSCKCQMSTAPIFSVSELLHFLWDCWETLAPWSLCAPKIQEQVALGLNDGDVL